MSLGRHKIDHAYDIGPMAPARIERRGHHDGQLPCDLTDQRLRNINIALHGLPYVFPIRVVLAVENADAVGADDVAALEAVHGHALVDDGALFLLRCVIVRQLRDAAGVHGHVLVGRQLLLNALSREHCGFAHHLVYGGDSAPIAQGATGCPYCDQCDQNGRHQADCNFFTNAVHLFPPQ